MIAQHDIGYLQALGITVYQLRGEKRTALAPEFTPVLGQQIASHFHLNLTQSNSIQQSAQRARASNAFSEAQDALRTPVSNDLPARSADKPAVQRQSTPKLSSSMPELVVPSVELARFAPSKLCFHLGIAILGRAIPAVENAVQSETALWFESPTGELKLGSLSLLRTSWRARRQAWMLLRAFRKLNPR